MLMQLIRLQTTLFDYASLTLHIQHSPVLRSFVFLWRPR
ncbi:unnamed protein product [Strongylus vulgaris]|uniref:Uncharacterized protein n=1 Tax=Strongylus vulgaris TaxID=40348 RepID=A0A3P7JI05_STRVU|nr:unnamed protein product [Strongylus vulgaris]